MHRPLLALFFALLAALVGVLLYKAVNGTRAIDLVDNAAGVRELLASREGTGAAVRGHGPFRLEPIDEATAGTLFVMHPADLVYDADVYYRYRPGVDQRIGWQEHPEGSWQRTTNALGLREDSDVDFSGADLKVLVTGDSHTDGVCNNRESFANVLEASLAEADPERSVVALNTGVVGYSFYNYLGALEEALAGTHGERPDVFVVAVYGGNDFIEALRPQHYFRGTSMPPRRPAYWDRIEAAKRVSTAALGQGLNQVAYFLEQPDQIDVALEACQAVMGEIARRCTEEGVRLCVVHIPAAFDVPWPGLEEPIDRALEALVLERDALSLGRELEAGLRERLQVLGVEYVDLAERFAASGELCYWERDLHISVVGHRTVAEVVIEMLDRQPSGAGARTESRPDGSFEDRDPDGHPVTRGAWKDGRRVGEWVLYHPSADGQDGEPRSRGSYEDGLRVGAWRWWYTDGQLLKQGDYDADREVGAWEEWYPDGKLRRRGTWVGGRPEGLWEEWHPAGTRGSRGSYVDGQYSGVWETFYVDGSPETLTTWVEGRLEGPSESWHPDGSRRGVGQNANGRAEGPWTYHHPGGALRSEGEFRSGKRVGVNRFFIIDGELEEERSGFYADGKRIRPLNEQERSETGPGR